MPLYAPADIQSRPRRWPAILAGSAIILLAVAALLAFTVQTPFNRGSLTERIGKETGLRVEAARYQMSWFPLAFHAEGVRIYPASGSSKPLLTGATIDVTASLLELIGRHRVIRSVRVANATASIPLEGARNISVRQDNHSITVSELRIENSVLNILAHPDDPDPLPFHIHRLVIANAGRKDAMGFRVSVTNPKPRGEIHATGSLGPWVSSDALATPVAGQFTFSGADLTIRNAITGILNGKGEFRGPLRAIECSGTADVSGFQVHGSRNAMHLSTSYLATVNARNGDVRLGSVKATFNSTTVAASGTVAGVEGLPGKVTRLTLQSRRARVEDLLDLFVRSKAPMKGAIVFDARVEIPPGPPDFLRRLAMTGDFTITGARFTNPKTQTPVDRLSGSARGQKKPDVTDNPPAAHATVRGHVADAHGMARLSRVTFEAPGIAGQTAGTFALHEKNLNFDGEIYTAGKLADTTTGFKSLMLKAMGPIWKKHGSVKKVPFRIRGTSRQPQFALAPFH